MSWRTRGRATVVATAVVITAAQGLAQAAKRPMAIDDMMSLKSVGAPAISPNGATVVFPISAWEHPAARNDTAKGDRHDIRSHLWLVPTDGSRPPRQITFSERGETQPQWSPDGSSIAFLSARGTATGDETPRPQLYVLPLSGGEAEKITDVKDGAAGFAWSPDGKRIAFLSVDSLAKEDEARRKRRDDPQVFEGDERLSHVWVVDVGAKKSKELLHTAQYTVRGTPSWSPDGARVAYLTSPTTLIRDERRAAFVVDVGSSTVTRIDAGGDIQGTPQWSPDGSTLAFAALTQTHKAHADSMMERELRNSHLVLYDVRSGKARDVSNAQFDNSPGTPQWSADGKRIYFTTGDRAWSSAYVFDVATGAYRKLTSKQLIRGLSYSKDGSRVAMLIDSPSEPADVYVTDPTFASPKRLTHANPQLTGIALGESEVVTWKSSDGQEVEGILLKPVGYEPGKRYPMLVEPHGGPTGAHTASFKASWGSPGQFWAGQGWAVLYPNPRGSTNYGEKWMRGNIPDWGGGDYRDIMTGVDAMIQRGIADGDKLAVAGWSYGGYMTAWIVSQTSRFKAAMMGAGLSDLTSMYGTTDIPGYIGTFFNGMPTKETLEFYRERSAITYVDKVTTPLLIQHGGNDQRVPIGQPMEFFRALKDRGKIVELVFYPREGHGFSEYYHQIEKVRREFDWINKYTLKTKTVIGDRR